MSKQISKIANMLAERVLEIIDQRSKLFNNRIIWTIDDVVNATGFAKQTIYNKVRKREIPFRKRSGKLFFIPEEILDWIHEGDEL